MARGHIGQHFLRASARQDASFLLTHKQTDRHLAFSNIFTNNIALRASARQDANQ